MNKLVLKWLGQYGLHTDTGFWVKAVATVIVTDQVRL
jgi:hypothetical protein